MSDYQVQLAKEFKKRENKNLIGNILGKVIKESPNLEISILDGQVILDSDNLYINEILLDDYERTFEIEGTMTLNSKTELAKAGVTGQATENPLGHQHDIKLNDNSFTSEGTIKFVDTLKKGDLVKLSPTIDEQIWFLDYKVRKV